MDPESVKAVEKLQETLPKTVGEVRQPAGILSYYRRYIRNFAKIAKPIYDLLTTTGNTGQLPSKTLVSWGSTQQAALEELVGHFSHPPIMAYSDSSKAFTLHTDASRKGLGAVLYQRHEGVMRVVAYDSRILSAAERNSHLHAGKLEFLALQWAKINATGLRWVNELADFHFDVRYQPGRANADADTFSCMPISFEEYMSGCSEMVSQDVLNAVTSSINESNSAETAWLSSLTATPIMLEEEFGSVSTTSPSDLSAVQQEDTTISRVLRFMQNLRRPTHQEKQQETVVVRQLLHEWNRLFLQKIEFSIINLDLRIK